MLCDNRDVSQVCPRRQCKRIPVTEAPLAVPAETYGRAEVLGVDVGGRTGMSFASPVFSATIVLLPVDGWWTVTYAGPSTSTAVVVPIEGVTVTDAVEDGPVVVVGGSAVAYTPSSTVCETTAEEGWVVTDV